MQLECYRGSSAHYPRGAVHVKSSRAVENLRYTDMDGFVIGLKAGEPRGGIIKFVTWWLACAAITLMISIVLPWFV